MTDKLPLPPRLDGWDGFEDPNYTPIPDSFFDRLLPILTDVEVRVLLYIMRRTYGFKKAADSISLSQIVNGITKRTGEILDGGAGVKRDGAIAAVRRLEARGILLVQHNQSAARGNEPTTYRVRKLGQPLLPLVGPTEKGESVPPTRGVGPTEKGDRPRREGGVGGTDSQETERQETERQDDSNQAPPPKKRSPRRNGMDASTAAFAPPAPVAPQDTAAPAAPYSAYIAGVVQDHSTDLGDGLHWRANVTQALRLWQASGFAEEAFVAQLHAARQLVRTYQGKQGSGTITNKMGYYFRCLSDRVGVPTELGTGR